ncbi:MAG TPA: cysteine desulfurase [Candidatus Poseidoniia archaeon]|jgi:cysteine desulfurase/selenocysteine lyase|nr:cysteine desulfurase [Candidatus Poseidoniia archaeon]
MLDESLKLDFPTLKQKINGNELVYLDNAATTQKPEKVIKALESYYRSINSNIHRGIHTLSIRATDAYEEARSKVAAFINAEHREEIIFVRGATEAINLVASSYVRPILKEGDQIIISQMEHHANIVPWQIICEQKKAELKIIPMNEKGELLIEEIEGMISEKTKFISINHVSNSLGTINRIEDVIKIAHSNNIRIMIDGAQAVQHLSVNLIKLNADFYCFSGHKVYAPTGIGVLYGKKELLEKMPPYQGGGDMIKSVTFEKTIYNDIPNRFEAGTPDIAGAIGLGVAIDYLVSIGIENIAKHEKELLDYATQKIRKIEGVRIIGNAVEKASVLSFVIEGIHPHDIGTIMDKQGVAIRTGHHCTQPTMDFYGVPATARASFAIYNTRKDVDALINSVKKTIEVFT